MPRLAWQLSHWLHSSLLTRQVQHQTLPYPAYLKLTLPTQNVAARLSTTVVVVLQVTASPMQVAPVTTAIQQKETVSF